MGIPYAFLYYYNKYNCVNDLIINFEELLELDINNLFFDFNSLIHPCAQQILSINNEMYASINDINERTIVIENDIIKNCLMYTRFITSQVLNNVQDGSKNVYIIIDGVAPRSKMNQQRERRYKSEFFKQPNNSEKSNLWDSNKITPGTAFMSKLSDALLHFAEMLKETLFLNCIISDSYQNGEGEHKIMTIISNLTEYDKIIIYGLDADLIMLSLMNKNHDQIILIRDNTFNNKLSDNKRKIDYLNIKNLRQYISNDLLNLLYNQKKINKTDINIQSLIYDYIIICFFLGNDFLDNLPSLSIKKNGIDTIMKAYAYAWKGDYLINKDQINDKIKWKSALNVVFLRDIMYQLKNHENYYFKNFKIDLLNSIDLKLSDELQQSGIVSFYKDDFINYNNDNYKQRYYTYYNIIDVDDACLNYIEGLYWIFGYYNTHIHKNWTWYYKYHNTPFCSDIFDFLCKTKIQTIDEYINMSENLIISNYFTPIKQLFMVLPKSSLYSILQEITMNNVDLLKQTLLSHPGYYPDKLYIDVFNKRFLWQTKIFFENIDDNIIDIFIE